MADQGLCRISFLVLFFLVVGSVYSADRRQAKVKKDETIEDYLKDHTVEVEPPSRNASPLDLYLHLLRLKRKEQIATAEKVMTLPDYDKQHKAITMLLEVLLPDLEESMRKIEKAGYSPIMQFPKDRDMQEEVGKVYENILMFGDFLLRMPDITGKLYARHKEWTGVLRWAVKFCSDSTEVFTGAYATHLELMKQELGLGPRDPNYINPFSNHEARAKTEAENVSKRKQTKREAMQEKMDKMKGPRLRTNRHNEL